MEKVLLRNDYDDEEVIVAPYYMVHYIDDSGRKHIAMITDEFYLQYLKDRFIVTECKYIPAEDEN